MTPELGSVYETNCEGGAFRKGVESNSHLCGAREYAKNSGTAARHRSGPCPKPAEFADGSGQRRVHLKHRFFEVILEYELVKGGLSERPGDCLKLSQDRGREF
jgi:hypothetical protein